MTEFMHLVGTEDISRAALSMNHAAETIRLAVGNLEGCMLRYEQFLNDWLYRMEEIMNRITVRERGEN